MPNKQQPTQPQLWPQSQSTPEAEAVRKQAPSEAHPAPAYETSHAEIDDDSGAGNEAEEAVDHTLAQRLARIRQDKQAKAVAHAEAAAKQTAPAAWPQETIDVPPGTRPLMAQPMPWSADAPDFELASGGGFFGMDRLHPAEQVHMLSLGGSGSGKTASNVAPVMRAMLRYALPTASGPKSTSLLIVDPKRELLDIVRSELSCAGQLERLHVLGDGDTPPVRFFDIACALSCRDRLASLSALVEKPEHADGNHAFWKGAGHEVALKFMGLERDHRLLTDLPLVGHLPMAMKLQSKTMPHFWQALSEVYRISMGGRAQFQKLAALLSQTLLGRGMLMHPDSQVLQAFTAPEDNYMQWAYRTQSVEPMLGLLGDTTIANVVDFDPFPEPEQHRLDLGVKLQ
jgi:hypothetical protein